MNLADAIRRAAQAPVPVSTTPAAVAWEEPEARFERPTSESIFEQEPLTPEALFSEEAPMSEEPQIESTESPNFGGTAVRLEMYLTPEQLSSLFRAVAANQHTLLTSREAASYLRVSATSLESLASEGSIPGFLVDGRWRFSKQAIDEWLTQQKIQKEAA